MDAGGIGWDAGWREAFAPWADDPAHRPARVAVEFNHLYRLLVVAPDGALDDVEGMTAGRLKHRAATRRDLPAVGDWVVVRWRAGEAQAPIAAVLPRRTAFSRKVAGHVTDEQVVAANVDVVFLVMALDADFSVRRLERYLFTAAESGAAPVVILTKPDLADDVPARVAEVTVASADLPVHVVNPRAGEGIETFTAYLGHGRTGALLGSSGVGKSTIINRMLGTDARRTREVRSADAKGRHTTTHRELVSLPGGGAIIDTPGMRELQLWGGDEGVREAFDDVEALTPGCRFGDCRHRQEPGCAVKGAVAEGRLPAERLESYLALQQELDALARQQDERAAREQKRQAKIAGKALNQHLRTKYR